MMLVKEPYQYEGGIFETFRLIPISKDCNFVECIFQLEKKVLVMLQREKYQTHQMFTKLDDNGRPSVLPGKPAQGQQAQYKQERKLVETFYDHSISHPDDVAKLVQVLTGSEVDLAKYFEPLPTKAKVPLFNEEQKDVKAILEDTK
jgi:hypothetical protein